MGVHRKVIRNTLFLYVRMFVTIIIALYTTRVVLATLGETNFGIYNVIGGFVAMFSFLTSTMSNASTRFFSYELAKENFNSRNVTFKVTFTIYLLIIGIIILLGESVGTWFVCNRLNIPQDRQDAAFWVYQFSLLALIFNVLRIPFNASIMAHEKMDFYAYLSIIESVLKLLIVLLLVVAEWDKLIFYSILLAGVVIVITIIYWIYCRNNFSECRIGISFSSSKFRNILSFSGWNLTSNFGDVMMDQGINILLNIYFGPVINAARGLAYNVKSVMVGFAGNFQAAATPQITKHYAASEIEPMNRLVVETSKLSYFLMLILVSSSLFCVKQLLNLWLTEVPPYTDIFTYLLFAEILVLSMGGTLNIAIQATGIIRNYVIALSIVKLINFVIIYTGFKYFNLNPQYAFIMCIVNSFGCMIVKFLFYRKIISASLFSVVNQILSKELVSTVITALIILIVYFTVYNPDILLNVVMSSCIMFVSVILIIFYCGLTALERSKTIFIIKAKFHK